MIGNIFLQQKYDNNSLDENNFAKQFSLKQINNYLTSSMIIYKMCLHIELFE